MEISYSYNGAVLYFSHVVEAVPRKNERIIYCGEEYTVSKVTHDIANKEIEIELEIAADA